MTVQDLIDKLTELNTGAPTDVLIGRDEEGAQYWDVAFVHSRIRVEPPAPYAHDNDWPFVLVLVPQEP